MRTLNHLIAFMLTAALPQTVIACPTKPVHPIIPFLPAGASDYVDRALGQSLAEMWG